MNKLTPFEEEAIRTILRGNHPVVLALRAQLDRCAVAHRELTGVGFFTSLAVPSDIPSVPLRRRLHLGDVSATMDGVAHGVGVVLFVDDGRLALLEGFTYDEPWPDEVVNWTIVPGGVTHLGGDLADIEQVDAAWDPPDASGDIPEH